MRTYAPFSRHPRRLMPSETPGSPRRDVRTLIVDDCRSFRVVARELLERRGYTVVGEAETAAGAIEAIERHPPDAVLLDVNLPDTSGAVVATYLNARYPAIAVLLVSADKDEDAYPLLEQTGARGFVNKFELARVNLAWYWPRPPQRGS